MNSTVSSNRQQVNGSAEALSRCSLVHQARLQEVMQALAAIESVLHPRQKRSKRMFPREDRSKVHTDRKQERFNNRSWFDVAVKEAQIPRITWHGLRHTFCSWLAMAGATTREIVEAAGHKTMG